MIQGNEGMYKVFPEIKITKNKQFLSRHLEELKGRDNMYGKIMERWIEEDYPCLAYYAVTHDKTLGFALVHKVDFDPNGIHYDPWILDLVWVQPTARRHGVATALLKKVVEDKQITSLCDSDVSCALHKQAGFKARGKHNLLYVYCFP